LKLINKYGIFFLSIIIFSKILYLALEIYYNGHLIDTVTGTNVTINAMEKLEELGHNISALGFSLLLLPFMYLVIKKFTTNRFKVVLLNFSVFCIVFFSFKIILTETMDYIVDKNSDKRFSSYYISIFKYGMLNNTMGYESFIPRDRIGNMSIEDKVIISNIFLLNYLDETLIDKLLNEGVNNIVDTIIKKYDFDRYLSEKTNIENKLIELINSYNQYVEASMEIKMRLKKYDNEDRLLVEYQDFQNKLHTQYSEYKINSDNVMRKAILSDRQMNNYYNDLKKYFRYKGYSKAEKEYQNNMNKNFGHYIEPSKWCQNNICPSKYAIQRTVRSEVYNGFIKESDGIPPALDERSFFTNKKVRKQVINTLQKKGLLVNDSFNYSYISFKKAYQEKLLNEKKSALATLSKKYGVNLKYGLTFKQFVNLYYPEIKKSFGEKYSSNIIEMFINKETTNFYETIYKPKYKEKILKDYLLKKEDFGKKENFEKGDNAIKMLYISPFAINISLLSALLNFISVVTLLLFLMFRIENKYLQNTIKSLLLILTILYPIYSSNSQNILEKYKVLNNSKINSENNLFLSNYKYLLKWVITVEKLCYDNIYSKF